MKPRLRSACRWSWALRFGPIRRRFGDEAGVFIPALMGVGILTSMAVLVADGVRKVLPFDSAQARAARASAGATGRARDLQSVVAGTPPRLPRVVRVPRARWGSIGLAATLGASAVVVARASIVTYAGDVGVLADRGWTLTVGLGIASALGLAALLALGSALLGERRPRWLQTAASVPGLGTYAPVARRPANPSTRISP